ncbi:MAG: fumarylacetoacetate hydrolase family protein [Gemmatimonadetes bacterium]|nr:fumarylacetoacetate hydrolase family protein [Gemmatimonadota bacterium]
MSLFPATVSAQAQRSPQSPGPTLDRKAASPSLQDGITRYVRFEYGGAIRYGILDGRQVTSLEGSPFGEHSMGDLSVDISRVRLLAPVEPSNVIAVGLNYQSHLGQRAPAEYPGLFSKYPTSIVGPDADIVRPPDSRNLHYEGELVIVIGKRAKNVSVAEAADYVFGVTAGNDISERDWQGADLQWIRAKGSDTFGPVGPWVVTGLDYSDLLLESRVNGEVRQSGRTSDLIFDVETIVSYVSRYITLSPGDIIFTGTPGSTRAMEPGDVVEVELEGVGVLRNTVVQGR